MRENFCPAWFSNFAALYTTCFPVAGSIIRYLTLTISGLFAPGGISSHEKLTSFPLLIASAISFSIVLNAELLNCISWGKRFIFP